MLSRPAPSRQLPTEVVICHGAQAGEKGICKGSHAEDDEHSGDPFAGAQRETR
jgi:hypothetical protein